MDLLTEPEPTLLVSRAHQAFMEPTSSDSVVSRARPGISVLGELCGQTPEYLLKVVCTALPARIVRRVRVSRCLAPGVFSIVNQEGPTRVRVSSVR